MQSLRSVAFASRGQYRNHFARLALAFGVVGLALAPVPVVVVLAAGCLLDVLSITFGLVALARAPIARRHGSTFAVVGLVFGSVGIALVLLGAGTIW
jgi:hydrogenase-4 membrane subunit HyfE